MNKGVHACLAALAMTASLSSQAVTVITFESPPGGLTAMTNAPGTAVPTSSQLTTQYLSGFGVSFSSLAGYAALVNHGAGNPTASVPNLIGGTTAAGALDYAQPITISFFGLADSSAPATTDFFKIQGDWFGLNSGTVTATAYGLDGGVLGSVTDTDDKPFGVAGPVLGFSLAGIHSVVISGTSGTVGFDNLEFGDLTVAPAIPEPSTWLLMLAGLGAVARVVSRRRAS